MDDTRLIGSILLGVAALLLGLTTAAEAGIIAISRSRVHGQQQNGSSALLMSYIYHRHAIVAALSAAATTTTIAGTALLTHVILGPDRASLPALGLVTVIAVVSVSLIRQTARSLATQNPEAVGIALAGPTRWIQIAFTPVSWFAGLPALVLLRAMGRPTGPKAPDTADELLAILEAPDGDDDVLSDERRMMRGVLDLSEQTVRELMSPRTDITAVSTDASIGDVLRVVTDSGFSRIPLYAEDVDHVVGVVYAKDLLAYFLSGEVRPRLQDIARPAYFVPETKRANDLLAEMRRNKVHLAIAVDEYGGTAGVVTVEDLLEEIVGEISDEYDTAKVEVKRISDDECIVDAGLALSELADLFGVEVEIEDVDTVGGLVVSRLGRLAVPGDDVTDIEHGLRLRVLSVVGRRVKTVRIERLSEVDQAPEAAVAE
ncbi:MAG: HlyC/CorC family transporter [Dehalococcoidia bacterium]|nr:HlyC/CorC family transporter [Dehalococcoidia bacterium]